MRWLALALLAAASPLAAQTADQSYREGVAARTAGQNERAIELLGRAVAAEPANADAHLQLGLALLAAGRLDEAERSFRRTLEIAPGYEDARIGLARVAQRKGETQRALSELEPVSPGNADAAGLRAQLSRLPAPAGLLQLDLDGSYSKLSGGRSDWREGSIQLRYQATPKTAIAGRLEPSRRFGSTDVYGELRLDQRLSPRVSAWFSLGGTPDADFRPEWQAGVGGALRVSEGAAATVLSLEARHAQYQSGAIRTFSPGLEQYLGDGGSFLTLRMINIFEEGGDHQDGWLVRGDLTARPGLRLFAGVADAPDVSEGVVTDTFSVFGGASIDVSDQSMLRVSLAREDREGGGERTQFGLGMGFRF
jgi:YaiO family outer membrane protein